jgi:uncharacterized protein YceK
VIRISLSMPSLLLIITLLSGCASSNHSRQHMNRYIEQYYAIIVDVEQVEFESEAGTSAAMGAIVGAAGHHGNSINTKIQSAIFHAFFYALFTKISEGSNHGFRYELKDLNGETFSIVSQTSGISHGDCVEILEGDSVSIHKTSAHYCYSDEDLD